MNKAMQHGPPVGRLGGAELMAAVLLGCATQPTEQTLRPLEPALAAPILSQTTPEDLALTPAAPRPEPVTVWAHLQQADEQLYAVLLRQHQRDSGINQGNKKGRSNAPSRGLRRLGV